MLVVASTCPWQRDPSSRCRSCCSTLRLWYTIILWPITVALDRFQCLVWTQAIEEIRFVKIEYISLWILTNHQIHCQLIAITWVCPAVTHMLMDAVSSRKYFAATHSKTARSFWLALDRLVLSDILLVVGRRWKLLCRHEDDSVRGTQL